MIPLPLDEVVAVTGATVAGPPLGTDLTADVEVDSRLVRPGSLFVALPGERSDGHDTHPLLELLFEQHGTDLRQFWATVEAGSVVPVIDERTRVQRLETLDEDRTHTGAQLDRAVTSPAQIRLVLETFRDRLTTEIFPGHTEVPKTLVFCEDEDHAEQVVTLAREVFGRGNDFAVKITY